jgi:hypothetical protein
MSGDGEEEGEFSAWGFVAKNLNGVAYLAFMLSLVESVTWATDNAYVRAGVYSGTGVLLLGFQLGWNAVRRRRAISE